ncbi:MAG: LysR family transcriptional regulator [Gammaproteobacteria bacterium]|nr:LysR family transcriptional regulator [Gammaproteobacteria bacterium]
MRRKIPSIEALVAFEAAARHQSFTRAADELALTQSAVGRQIVLLEEYLGVLLFNRIKKRVSLTEIGQLYAKEIREDLNNIERHTLAAMSHHGVGGVLELAVIPTFASRWLIPRLPQFYALWPDITLNLTTRAEPFLFTDTPFDGAIHFGSPIWPGTVVEHLFGEEMVPVCSPNILAGRSELLPSDMEKYNLLHQSARPDAWRQWFAQAGISHFNGMKGARYELFSMLVEAARAGLGIALVPRFLVLSELAESSLCIPCHLSLRSEQGYYLAYPERKQSSALVQAFKEWLLSAAKQYRQLNL